MAVTIAHVLTPVCLMKLILCKRWKQKIHDAIVGMILPNFLYYYPEHYQSKLYHIHAISSYIDPLAFIKYLYVLFQDWPRICTIIKWSLVTIFLCNRLDLHKKNPNTFMHVCWWKNLINNENKVLNIKYDLFLEKYSSMMQLCSTRLK